MNKEYSFEQVVAAGSQLVDFLLENCNSSSNVSGFLKTYLDSLTSEDGVYKQQKEALDSFSMSNQTIAEEAKNVVDTSKNNSQEINRMCENFGELNDKIIQLQKGRTEVTENVKNLTQEIKEIGGYIRDIQDVSEQIHLISFNASVEAAHAGNAGKGFRIIANEVKKLSDSTTDLSNNIFKKMQDLEKTFKRLIENNSSNDQFMGSLQQTAISSSSQLERINEDSAKSLDFTQNMLQKISESRKSVSLAAQLSSEKNIVQVQKIANTATSNNIEVNNQLSFLYELKALFEWLENYRAESNQKPTE